MTKYDGKYYLQYGAPGTEYNVYATGVYVSDTPLGPFTYAPYNPIAYKPGGFVQGAGHGNTFQDVYGNWWNTGTPWIGVNWNFERRIGLHPAGFDRDGQLHVDTRFGDFPHWLPSKAWRSSDELFTGWMLLSYRKPVTASSSRDDLSAAAITDENPRTFWVASRNRPGERVTVDLLKPYTIRAVQVNYADYRSGSSAPTRRSSRAFESAPHSTASGGAPWPTSPRSGATGPMPTSNSPRPFAARYVRYDHVHVGAANLAISDIRVFGNGSGPPPRTPEQRHGAPQSDTRNATIEWGAVPGVVGYNVRWGIAPTKLYQTYQRFADEGTTLELRALTVGVRYWVAIESFDENGVSTLGEPVEIR